jgi:toxin CcdB
VEQFDLYANLDENTKATYPYLVIVQSDLIDELNSRVVVPLTLLNSSDEYPRNLCPTIIFDGGRFALLTHQLASVSSSILTKRVGSLRSDRDNIISAIDFVILGI